MNISCLKFNSNLSVANKLNYRQFSSMNRTESQHLNDTYFVLQLPLPNPLQPGVNSRITEICAELLLARWAPHFDYNSPAGNFWVVAGSDDPWRCGLASPSMGSWINSAGVLPHFAEDDPSLEALEGDRTVRQWITQWRCSWSSADLWCSNYICVNSNFIAY